MKIIDLLNKIANGEEVPEKIKFKNNIYGLIERNDNVYNYKQIYNGRFIDNYLCDDWFIDSKDILNDEVEIIEENKKIEKINCRTFEFMHKPDKVRLLMNKINEIIDYLEDKDEQ